MLRNWYAVYTRPQKEKVVSLSLSKKGFESFCPFVNNSKARMNRKISPEPLFVSHVFVYAKESDLSAVRIIPGVVSILYWKSRPAIIKSEEIEAVRLLSITCSNIKLTKSVVKIDGEEYKDEPTSSFDNNTLSVKSQTMSVALSSLGYVVVGEKNLLSEEEREYGEPSLFRTFPKRINSFFFN